MRILSTLLFTVLLAISSCWAVESQLKHFITAKGDQLYEGDQQFRFMSFNIPNLHLVEDNFSFADPNPWRWPNEFEIADALESIRQMGGQVTRMYVLSVRREGSDQGEHVFVEGPGQFNEEAFRTLDKVLQIANEKGVRVILPLVDNWHWWGGRAEYAGFRGKEPDDFWTDEQVIADFEETIRFTLNRVNTLTGVAYKDDPAIFAWETGNELDSPPAWTRRISAFIKSIDSKHLLIDGYALHGVRQESLDDPNIDVITTHHYPNTDKDYVKAIVVAHEKIAGRKPYFVGEFGFAPTKELRRVMNTIVERGISGGLHWSLRFHNRDGGFYWHSEPSGGDHYKAYHWPGFSSGERYQERELLQLTRNKAFEIRGLPVPEFSKPDAPKLLPTSDVSKITWQGSAGASSYNIHRAVSGEGPWKVVGQGISDAAVQYRPLFNDRTAKVGEAYFYRVVARNEAGSSPPCDAIGPVSVLRQTLIDEYQDLNQLSNPQGELKQLSTDARKTQEDAHRLTLSPGSSIEYHCEGPIDRWQLMLYHSGESIDLEVACSAEGKQFSPCKVRRRTRAVEGGDYGYLKPLLLSGKFDGARPRFLRFSRSAGSGQPEEDLSSIQLSRVEIQYSEGRKSLAGPSKKVRHGAQLNPSILMFHKPHHFEGMKYVRRAAELGCKHVNLVVTLFCDINEQREVISFGTVNRKREYSRLTQESLAAFRFSLQGVFAEAAALDMDVSVLAHLNAGGEIYDWRNRFEFDPLTEYEGFSYQDAVIGSIADALEKTVKPGMQIDLALAGEMGQSVFAHPASYRKMMQHLRSDTRLQDLKVGVSFNFNNAANKQELTSKQREEAQLLVNDCDFVGMSNYRWFDLPIQPSDFARAVKTFLAEMSDNGAKVPLTTPLHFSEVGIGGGTEGGLASTSAEAARTPWHGSDEPQKNPWASEAMSRFRVEFHQALLEFLAHPTATNPITEAFLWSEGSWDPMDITDKGFADQQIIELIQQHNNALTND
ncbi:cellulase family glycosylhydrolase [Adhaeretor mobilis]|uniref:mannan endo-1,4-beta-mannosidase n=1 Tax=Adhaeretor mobilis TaxID=1930276 RepID=A0A517MWC1_9BACT|nr:cellulase family glycosylhydrolase [Adhaeretor mobilis]QDS99181.1 hypothetical protein HG15A2_24730 [Adhaeretor mobilis]